MTFDSITTTLFEMWLAGTAKNELQTVCLLGAPGIGKTSSARELAVQMTEHRRLVAAARADFEHAAHAPLDAFT